MSTCEAEACRYSCFDVFCFDVFCFDVLCVNVLCVDVLASDVCLGVASCVASRRCFSMLASMFASRCLASILPSMPVFFCLRCVSCWIVFSCRRARRRSGVGWAVPRAGNPDRASLSQFTQVTQLKPISHDIQSAMNMRAARWRLRGRGSSAHRCSRGLLSLRNVNVFTPSTITRNIYCITRVYSADFFHAELSRGIVRK